MENEQIGSQMRAWDTETKEMLNPVEIALKNGVISSIVNAYGEAIEVGKDNPRIILMPYTTKKDCNGKNIFMYDIIEVLNKGYVEGFSLVQWIGAGWRFKMVTNAEKEYSKQNDNRKPILGSFEIGRYASKFVKVIGNKFEHPELIKKTDKYIYYENNKR